MILLAIAIYFRCHRMAVLIQFHKWHWANTSCNIWTKTLC